MMRRAPRPARAVLGVLLLAGAAAVPASAAQADGDRSPTTLWMAFPLDPAKPTATGPVTTSEPSVPSRTVSGQAEVKAAVSGDEGDDMPWGILIAAAAALVGLALVSVGIAGGWPGRRRAPPAAASAVAEPLRGARSSPPVLQPALPAALTRPTVETCTVRWRPDPDLSDFVVAREDAPEVILARSPGFRWRSANPPPRRAAIVSAHAELTERLRDQGWMPLEPDPGARWYERRYSRPADR
jgi:hypothetical protein